MAMAEAEEAILDPGVRTRVKARPMQLMRQKLPRNQSGGKNTRMTHQRVCANSAMSMESQHTFVDASMTAPGGILSHHHQESDRKPSTPKQ